MLFRSVSIGEPAGLCIDASGDATAGDALPGVGNGLLLSIAGDEPSRAFGDVGALFACGKPPNLFCGAKVRAAARGGGVRDAVGIIVIDRLAAAGDRAGEPFGRRNGVELLRLT